jgi:hypothetical protein
MSVAEPRDLLRCSFCDKSQQKVRKLIAGPGVYVCDECVALCNEIIDGELADEGLVRLRDLTARSDALVERLRADGVPWEEIAAALRPPEET